jgi:cytochrome c peroxidase
MTTASAKRRARARYGWGLLAAIGIVSFVAWNLGDSHRYSEQELDTLRSLWIGSLPAVPPDASNRHADDRSAAALGERLFFDTRFSITGTVSCATCHQPDRNFTDGLPLARGVGDVPRKTMTVVGIAHDQWLFWDGRKDSLWAQALGPLESLVEHGGTRTQYARLVAEHYAAEYEPIFGTLPDMSDTARFPEQAGPYGDEAAQAAWHAMRPEDREAVTTVFVNIGKAIAAYERLLMPAPSRFDSYVDALFSGDRGGLQVMSSDEVAGMRLFIGDAGCTQCHNGPLLASGEFHNTGVPQLPDRPADTGRAPGVHEVLADEFNCLSAWSDAGAAECAHLRFIRIDDHGLAGAFKVTTLRNVAEAAPYMDAGQFETLDEVLRHYNQAPPASVGHSELEPLGLSETQLHQLEAFLRTLSAPISMPSFAPASAP